MWLEKSSHANVESPKLIATGKNMMPLRKLIKSILDRFVGPGCAFVMLSMMKLAARTTSAEDDNNAILVSFPFSSLGDSLVLIPFLEKLREAFPRKRVDLLAGHRVASFLSDLAIVDQVFSIPTVPHKGEIGWRVRELSIIVKCFNRYLRSRRYQLAIAPRWGSDQYACASRYLMFAAYADRRVSYSASVDGGTRLLELFSTNVATGGATEPESLRMLRLLDRAGILSSSNDVDRATESVSKPLCSIAQRTPANHLDQILRGADGVTWERYAIISPGATKATHRWPIERYAEVIGELGRSLGCKFLAIGGEAEKSDCDFLMQKHPDITLSLAGKTTLHELVAITKKAILFIGNDSGPAHLAGNLGIPSVVLNPFSLQGDKAHKDAANRWRPNGPSVKVLQPVQSLSPCTSGCLARRPHCILQIQVLDVLRTAHEAAKAHLRRTDSTQPVGPEVLQRSTL